MTSINNVTLSNGYGAMQIGRLQDVPGMKISRIDPAMQQEMEEVWKNQFRIPTGKADNDPSYVYATVKVGGKVVATIYNSGGTATSNATYGQVKNLPSMGEAETLTGPALAEKRAAEIAKKLGGTVEKAATAMTDSQWINRPDKPGWTYDTKAMAAAEAERAAFRQAQDAASRTLFDAQMLAQQYQDAALTA